MNAAKKNSKRPKFVQLAVTVFSIVFRRQRNAFLGIGMAVLMISAAVVAWGKFGPEIMRDSRYRLSLETVEVTAPPKWIHADVKQEVMRDGGLGELSLLDKSLVAKVADAFALHPWVAEVTSVQKRPDRVVVDLDYRRPVAMVKVTTGGRDGLIPVDKNGILLPTDDFSISEIRSYLRVEIPNISPYANAGVAWEDQRVVDAAQLAAAWGNHWHRLKLYRIVARPHQDDPFHRRTAYFELQTRLGSRILWGHAPGRETDGEADAKTKIEALLAYARQQGTIESGNQRFVVDVQSGQLKPLANRTADRIAP